MEAHKVYKDAGYQDGLDSFPTLTRKTTEKIAYTLNGDDPKHQGSTLYEIVSELDGKNYGNDREYFTSRASDLIEGIISSPMAKVWPYGR